MKSQKWQDNLASFLRQIIQNQSNPSQCPRPGYWRIWSWLVLWNLQSLLELTPEKDVFFITGDWNGKVGSQQIPGVTGKFGLRVQNEAGQRLTELYKENTLAVANTLLTTQEMTLQMSITIWPIPKSDVLCGQRWRSCINSVKQDLELTVSQIMSSLLQNSGLNCIKQGKI